MRTCSVESEDLKRDSILACVGQSVVVAVVVVVVICPAEKKRSGESISFTPCSNRGAKSRAGGRRKGPRTEQRVKKARYETTSST